MPTREPRHRETVAANPPQGADRAAPSAPIREARTDPSPNPLSVSALDPGRACVSLSRHQYGCVVVARAGIEQALRDHTYDSGERPLGSDDRVWRGSQIHLRVLQDLRRLGRLIPA